MMFHLRSLAVRGNKGDPQPEKRQEAERDRS